MLKESGLVYRACNNNNMEVLRILADNGVAIDDPVLTEYACRNNNMEMLRFLVEEKGIPIHRGCLFQATKNKNEEMLIYLIEHGADVAYDPYIVKDDICPYDRILARLNDVQAQCLPPDCKNRWLNLMERKLVAFSGPSRAPPSMPIDLLHSAWEGNIQHRIKSMLMYGRRNRRSRKRSRRSMGSRRRGTLHRSRVKFPIDQIRILW